MRDPWLANDAIRLYYGGALGVLREMDDESVDCCVTSPPYLRTSKIALEKDGRPAKDGTLSLFSEPE